MKFKCKVEDYIFHVNVGQGYNDFAWLALLAAKLYSNKKNPDSNYQPCYLQFQPPGSDFPLQPPPRSKIFEYLKQSDDPTKGETLILVDILKGGIPLSQEQQIWCDQAFGSMRNQFKTKFVLPHQIPKLLNRPEPNIFVEIEYKMFPEVQSEFNPKDYPNVMQLPMKGQDQGNNLILYTAEITLPLGWLNYKFCTQTKIDKGEDNGTRNVAVNILDHNVPHEVHKFPNPISQEDIQKKIIQFVAKQDALIEDLKKQEQNNQKEKQPGQLCPYKFAKVWTIIENNADGNLKLPDLEENLYQKISDFMEQSLSRLYEVFYQYTLLYDQDTEKKDEISITFQDVMHFLKFYGLVQDSSLLFDFVEYYDQDDQKSNTVQNSLKLSVKFPEFIVIIIKLADFRKTKNFIDVETQDQLIKMIVEKIISIDADETEFNNFQMHMKFNVTLVNFLRENQKQFQNIFISRLSQTKDSFDRKCHIRREEIKQLIQDSGYKGDNLDMIIETCYKELFNDEKYQGFEGLFYYEFLQVLQWLALVLIQNDEKEQVEENEEVGTMEELIEKLTYFIRCIEF